MSLHCGPPCGPPIPMPLYLFYTLEDKGWLNDSNHTDLLALHYVFVPCINCWLDELSQTCGHHHLRIARNQSPYQL